MEKYNLDVDIEAVRKNWLFTSILFLIALPIFGLFYEFIIQQNFEKDSFLENTLVVLMDLFRFLILRELAYKRHGNIFLTLTLIATFCLSISSLYFLSKTLYEGLYFHYSMTVIVLSNACFIPWLISSIKLIKVNRKIKLASFYNSEEYAQAFTTIQGANSIGDLHAKFGSLVRTWPRLEPILKKAYAAKKLELS